MSKPVFILFISWLLLAISHLWISYYDNEKVSDLTVSYILTWKSIFCDVLFDCWQKIVVKIRQLRVKKHQLDDITNNKIVIVLLITHVLFNDILV